MLGRVALLCALLTSSAADAADRYHAPRTSFGAPSLEGGLDLAVDDASAAAEGVYCPGGEPGGRGGL
jgi:hypothetical protein